MGLPHNTLSLKLRRAAYDLIASGILEVIPLNKWLYEGKHYELPIVLRNVSKAVLGTKISVPSKGVDEAWLLKVITNGNALLRIDNRDYAGVDEYHTYHPVIPGSHSIELVLSSFRVYGDYEPYLILYSSYLVRVNTLLFKVGVKALGLIDLAEKLGEKGIMDKLSSILELGQAPTHHQMAVTLITLWLGPPYISKQRVLPSPTYDYFLAAGLYGPEITSGNHLSFELDPLLVRRASMLSKELDKLLSKILNGRLRHTIYIAGHSHIDTAWLWDYLEAKRKVWRTFSTAAKLAEESGMKFLQSSALHTKWVEEESPELFERLRRLVSKGYWIPVSGMLVEPDLWMIDGESLARHLLIGQRVFMEKLGRASTIGWLPDSFGYPSSLPQILIKAGVKLLVIYKTNWNIINKPPYHAFIWRGIDGTEIPVFVIPTSYAEILTPSHVLEYDRRSKVPKEVPILMPYGYSDGGGGPTWEEMIYREQLLKTVPKVREINEDELIKAYEKVRHKLPRISGDLLLELHKGTLTTNHRIKDSIARAEMLVRSAEISEVLVRGNSLSNLWERLLPHTFHDVLPGSSIPKTYEEALNDIEEVIHLANGVLKRNLSLGSEGYTIYNDLPWVRPGIVILNQCIEGGMIEYCSYIGWGEYAAKIKPTPGIGASWSEPRSSSTHSGSTYVDVGEVVELGNEFLELHLSRNGEILRLKDSKGSNYLDEPSNQLLLHNDRPPMFDAWELDPSGLMDGEPLRPISKPKILASGGNAACVEFSMRASKSKVLMRLCLFSGSSTVRVDAVLDWRDRLKYLKTWFKPSVWSDRAWFELPFGAASRPTLLKSREDYALLYEVPALRWVDVSSSKGIAIISMHKHGYSVFNGRVGLTLHKAPTIPDPYSGIGRFRVTYFLYPHMGDTWEARVPIIAYELWSPLKVLQGRPAIGERVLWVEPEKDAIITGMWSSGSTIYANIYNPYPSSREVRVEGQYRVVGESDLLGRKLGSIDSNVYLRGFEVKTLILRRKLVGSTE